MLNFIVVLSSIYVRCLVGCAVSHEIDRPFDELIALIASTRRFKSWPIKWLDSLLNYNKKLRESNSNSNRTTYNEEETLKHGCICSAHTKFDRVMHKRCKNERKTFFQFNNHNDKRIRPHTNRRHICRFSSHQIEL